MIRKKTSILLLVFAVASCSRGEAFYRKRCLFFKYKDADRAQYCKLFTTSKVDKTTEQLNASIKEVEEKTKVEEKKQPDLPQPKIAEPKPVPHIAEQTAIKTQELKIEKTETSKETKSKTHEELQYEEWLKSVEASVGKLDSD
jgi:hypothetical protein